jgi:hypothetical protein
LEGNYATPKRLTPRGQWSIGAGLDYFTGEERDCCRAEALGDVIQGQESTRQEAVKLVPLEFCDLICK